MPFPTALLGEYWDTHLAGVLYGASLSFTYLVEVVLWWYATDHHRLVDGALSRTVIRAVYERTAIGAALYALGALLSLIAVEAGIVTYAAALIFFVSGFRGAIGHFRATTSA